MKNLSNFDAKSQEKEKGGVTNWKESSKTFVKTKKSVVVSKSPSKTLVGSNNNNNNYNNNYNNNNNINNNNKNTIAKSELDGIFENLEKLRSSQRENLKAKEQQNQSKTKLSNEDKMPEISERIYKDITFDKKQILPPHKPEVGKSLKIQENLRVEFPNNLKINPGITDMPNLHAKENLGTINTTSKDDLSKSQTAGPFSIAEKRRLMWEKERAELQQLGEYNPWGKSGCGAPIKDQYGNIYTDYSNRKELLRNVGAKNYLSSSDNTLLNRRSMVFNTNVGLKLQNQQQPSYNGIISDKEVVNRNNRQMAAGPSSLNDNDNNNSNNNNTTKETFTANNTISVHNNNNNNNNNIFDDNAHSNQNQVLEKSHMHGQNIPVDEVVRREKEEKRRKYTEHQEYLRKQIEDKKMAKRAELERRKGEELAEEEAFQQRVQQQQHQHQYKQQQEQKQQPQLQQLKQLKQQQQFQQLEIATIPGGSFGTNKKTIKRQMPTEEQEEMLHDGIERARLEAERMKQEKKLRALLKCGHDISKLRVKFEEKFGPFDLNPRTTQMKDNNFNVVVEQHNIQPQCANNNNNFSNTSNNQGSKNAKTTPHNSIRSNKLKDSSRLEKLAPLPPTRSTTSRRQDNLSVRNSLHAKDINLSDASTQTDYNMKVMEAIQNQLLEKSPDGRSERVANNNTNNKNKTPSKNKPGLNNNTKESKSLQQQQQQKPPQRQAKGQKPQQQQQQQQQIPDDELRDGEEISEEMSNLLRGARESLKKSSMSLEKPEWGCFNSVHQQQPQQQQKHSQKLDKNKGQQQQQQTKMSTNQKQQPQKQQKPKQQQQQVQQSVDLKNKRASQTQQQQQQQQQLAQHHQQLQQPKQLQEQETSDDNEDGYDSCNSVDNKASNNLIPYIRTTNILETSMESEIESSQLIQSNKNPLLERNQFHETVLQLKQALMERQKKWSKFNEK